MEVRAAVCVVVELRVTTGALVDLFEQGVGVVENFIDHDLGGLGDPVAIEVSIDFAQKPAKYEHVGCQCKSLMIEAHVVCLYALMTFAHGL